MTQPYGVSLHRALKRTAFCGLFALVVHFTGGSQKSVADDGVARVNSDPTGVYVFANCAHNDADMLNRDNSFGIGRGRIPFDRWYYLRIALGYKRIYPANTRYVDPRDRRVYSAAGYGVPMAVPLPSNVIYQYNYSAGRQGSRLTPVSRP